MDEVLGIELEDMSGVKERVLTQMSRDDTSSAVSLTSIMEPLTQKLRE